MTRDEVFDWLSQNNIAQVQLEFSGGNDEGGVDLTSFYGKHPEGTEYSVAMSEDPYVIEAHGAWYTDKDGNEIPEGMKIIRDVNAWRMATYDEIILSKVHEALAKPIYDRYHTFAGDFYVQGTLVWDVPNRKVIMGGSEEVKSYEPFTDEV